MRPRATIRFRITAMAGAVMALVLLFAATFLTRAHRDALTDRIDESVRDLAEDIADLVEDGDIPDPLPGTGNDDVLAQLVGADGRVVAASTNMAGQPAVRQRPVDSEEDPLVAVKGLPSDEEDEFRLLSWRIRGAGGVRYVLHVAAESDDVEESVSSLRHTLAVVFPAVLVVMTALIWLVVRRALQPVEAIRAEVANITAAELDRRVPQPPGDDEISRLAGTMNAMLERVETAHRRQQRFVADASHELRSPLTSIRSELEVDLAHPDAADLSATHRSVLEETQRLGRLVDNLLFLARTDAGVVPPPSSILDLDEIVLREARALRLQGRVTVDTSAVSGAQVRGDAEQLGRVVRNLLDNAGRHAASAVVVTLGEIEDTVVLAVSDDGPGLPPDQADRIFERFVRVDAARARDHGGTGLGLAIASEIVALSGGTIALDHRTTAGARFVVRLPRAG